MTPFLVEEGPQVICDLQDAVRFVHRGGAGIAQRFLTAAYDTFDELGRFHELGRRRNDVPHPDLRSWHVRGFRQWLVFYQVEPNRILIWRVLHGARDLSRELADLL